MLDKLANLSIQNEIISKNKTDIFLNNISVLYEYNTRVKNILYTYYGIAGHA